MKHIRNAFPRLKEPTRFNNQIDYINFQWNMLYELCRDEVEGKGEWEYLFHEDEYKALALVILQKATDGYQKHAMPTKEVADLMDLAQMLFRLEGYDNSKAMYDGFLGLMFVPET